MKRSVAPDSLVIDRPCPTRTRAVNVVSSDRLSQHGENNKSKRRQIEFIPSRLEKCGLGIIMIKVNGVTSQPKLLDCGVPQGSVLGPILFTIYTASLGQLPRQLDVQYHFYADDSQLWVIFKPPELDTAIGQWRNA